MITLVIGECTAKNVTHMPVSVVAQGKFASSSFRGTRDLLIETTHDKTYKRTCATSEDLDQAAHPRSLIRVLANHMCLLQALQSE